MHQLKKFQIGIYLALCVAGATLVWTVSSHSVSFWLNYDAGATQGKKEGYVGATPCEAQVRSNDPASHALWKVGHQGPTVILFWSPLAFNQQEVRIFVSGEAILKGGGTEFLYPEGCEDDAWAKYEESEMYSFRGGPLVPRLAISISDFYSNGLIYQPKACKVRPAPVPHLDC